MVKEWKCPFALLREYPDCFQDCPNIEECKMKDSWKQTRPLPKLKSSDIPKIKHDDPYETYKDIKHSNLQEPALDLLLTDEKIKAVKFPCDEKKCPHGNFSVDMRISKCYYCVVKLNNKAQLAHCQPIIEQQAKREIYADVVDKLNKAVILHSEIKPNGNVMIKGGAISEVLKEYTLKLRALVFTNQSHKGGKIK